MARAEHIVFRDETGQIREHVMAGVYHGPTEGVRVGRQTRHIERLFSSSNLIMDQLLVDSLVRAEADGRHVVTGLDIGSGRFGLYGGLVQFGSYAQKTRDFLREHPNFKVELIGLTDLPSADFHLAQLPFTINWRGWTASDMQVNRQIRPENYAYALTASQPLGSFLRDLGVDQLDFVFAVNSLRYLSPKIFKEVVETGINYLAPGGTFMTYYFTGNLPWTIGGYNNGFNTAASWVRRMDDRSQFSKRELHQEELYDFVTTLNGNAPLAEPQEFAAKEDLANREPKRYEKLVHRAWDFYQKLEVLSPEQILKAEKRVKHKRPLSRYTKTERLKLLAYLTLVPAYYRFEQRGRLNNLRLKEDYIQAIFENIPGVEGEWIPYNREELKRRDKAELPLRRGRRNYPRIPGIGLVWEHPNGEERGGFILRKTA